MGQQELNDYFQKLGESIAKERNLPPSAFLKPSLISLDIYDDSWDTFDFRFQTAGNGASPRTKENTDVFYHVLLTCWRTLIFKVPVAGLTTNPDGAFAKMKNPCLDRPSIQRRRQEGTDIRTCLVSSQYDPMVFQQYPEFFAPKPTLF